MRGTPVPILSETEIGEFWDASARAANGCLEWTGSLNGPRGSYGLFTIRRDGRRIRLMAHRVALALATGKSDGIFACHHCDNPPCIDPAHLYWGDASTNAKDASDRGRLQVPTNRDGSTGRTRPDVTRRHIANLRARGIEPAAATSSEVASWYSEQRLESGSLDHFADRIRRGEVLPELIA